MSSRPRRVTHYSYDYDPYEVKEDYRVSCSVCGFNGIDPIRTAEPEMAPFTTTVTGTVYQPDAGQSYANADKVTTTEYPAYGCCPLCGSPNWSWGSANDLKW